MKFRRTSLSLALALLLVALALVSPTALRQRPVYACSAPVEDSSLDSFAASADSIALIRVFDAGGPDNRLPPLPLGTPLRSEVGPGGVPAGFTFQGIGAEAVVMRTIAGQPARQIVIDEGLRSRMELTVRRWELGERFVACFFSTEDRYEVGRNYLVFLRITDEGLETLRAYRIEGPDVVVAPAAEPNAGHLHHFYVRDSTYQRHFAGMGTKDEGGLWRITRERVPLGSLLAAIAEMRRSSITPPGTGDGGLR